MADDFQYDVFLSHNARDKPRVRELAARLRDAGLRVWLDEWVVKAGDIIPLAVEEGLDQSRTLVLCLSAHALASDWVKQERSTAIHRDPSNTGRRFIPLLLTDCELPDTLLRSNYVDFREEAAAEFAEACETKQHRQPMFDRIHCNLHQSRTRGTLRQALLPTLLSGEFSVAGPPIEKNSRP